MLVDAHVHVTRRSQLKLAWDRWAWPGREAEVAALYDGDEIVPERFHALLAREGVDTALVLAEYSPRVTGLQPVEDIVPLVRHDPARVRLVANLNPHLHHPIVAELERQLALGAVALKIHPVHGGFPANARELYPAYARCERERIPVVFHFGTSVFPGAQNRFADPLAIEDVATDFPELTIVLAHGGRGWWYDAAAFMALMRENVWIELSGLPPRKLPLYYARFDLARLARKFVFGTDWPGVPGIRANAEAIAALGLPEDVLAGVLAENARTVYGL
jgi:predicted TIM-barrel fold metal-dependent hydrolase